MTVEDCLRVYAILAAGGVVGIMKSCRIEMESPFMTNTKESTVWLNFSGMSLAGGALM